MAAVAALAASIAAGLLVPGPAPATIPNLDWTSLLPPLDGPANPQPGPVPHCRVSTPRCVDGEVRRLRRLQAKLGCDHRAVFTTTYLELTKGLRTQVRRNPRFFQHPHYLYTQDALFADVYFDTVHGYEKGADVAPAWRIAFETAANGDQNGAQDMLLGINAHVQNDMPFVIAALGLRTPRGGSRKPDHDDVNRILDRAYGPVVHAIRDHYDSLVGFTNSDLTPLDDFGGLELTRGWREVVWREAERLASAKTQAERDQVAGQIQAHAQVWAEAIANANLTLPPGYRATRDAYCAAHPIGH